TPLPVLARNLYVQTLRMPIIERIVNAAGDDDPIELDSALRVTGHKLSSPGAFVRVGGNDIPPASTTFSDEEIRAPLPSGLAADVPAADVAQIVFHVKRVKPGTYLVRVQVDGAETTLETTAGAFSGPTVALP